MLQQDTGEVMESEDGSIEFETPTDDEEVTIPSQDKYKKVPDIPNSDIRDEQTLSNTQREDWLLPTEPMHVARPRQTGRERPPVIDHPALRDPAGNTAVRNPSRTFLLSPGRRINAFGKDNISVLNTLQAENFQGLFDAWRLDDSSL